KEKIVFQDSIDKALDLQDLIANFKTTHAERNMQYLLSPMPTSALAWNELIEGEVARGNYHTAYGLLHTYASLSLKEGTIAQTLDLLQSALQHAQKTPNTSDVAIIQYNLANIYLYDRNIQQAGYFQEAYYNTAVQQKSIIDQANSLLRIALIQAHDKDYRSAENNIIRKEIGRASCREREDGKVVARAVDGIRDFHVTGVQTCALPIYNLANIYLYDRNIQQAGYFQEAYYNTAVQQKSIIDQANSLLRIALIQAHDKDYRSAENNIIRK